MWSFVTTRQYKAVADHVAKDFAPYAGGYFHLLVSLPHPIQRGLMMHAGAPPPPPPPQNPNHNGYRSRFPLPLTGPRCTPCCMVNWARARGPSCSPPPHPRWCDAQTRLRGSKPTSSAALPTSAPGRVAAPGSPRTRSTISSGTRMGGRIIDANHGISGMIAWADLGCRGPRSEQPVSLGQLGRV